MSIGWHLTAPKKSYTSAIACLADVYFYFKCRNIRKFCVDLCVIGHVRFGSMARCWKGGIYLIKDNFATIGSNFHEGGMNRASDYNDAEDPEHRFFQTIASQVAVERMEYGCR